MEPAVVYDFEKGLYRAYIKTGYRNGNMQEKSKIGKKFEFNSNREPYVPTYGETPFEADQYEDNPLVVGSAAT